MKQPTVFWHGPQQLSDQQRQQEVQPGSSDYTVRRFSLKKPICSPISTIAAVDTSKCLKAISHATYNATECILEKHITLLSPACSRPHAGLVSSWGSTCSFIWNSTHVAPMPYVSVLLTSLALLRLVFAFLYTGPSCLSFGRLSAHIQFELWPVMSLPSWLLSGQCRNEILLPKSMHIII